MSDSMPVKEIVNSLESCAQWFEEHEMNTNTAVVPICRSAIYIINCQEEEIKELQKSLMAKMDGFETEYDNKIRAEAIKEFAEKLKESVEYIPWCDYAPVQRCIDDLAKEMEV